MSLKKTRSFLEHYARAMPPGHPAPGGDSARAALTEIAALEKAAKALRDSQYGRGWASNGVHKAFALVETIAKEAVACAMNLEDADWDQCARCRQWLMVENMERQDGRWFCTLCGPGGNNV